MKKLLGFSIIAMLAIAPAFADDPAPTPVAGTPTHADPATLAVDGNSATIAPGYALANANASTDGNAASAGYVKGAYNSSIKAVNTVASLKQDMLSSTNVVDSGNGPFVANVSASNGTVTVAKSDISVPVGSASSSTRASIWIQ